MAYDLSFNPQWSRGGIMDPYASTPSNNINSGGSSIFDYLMSQQPTPWQSFATAAPFYNLPQKQGRYFQPANEAAQALLNPDSPLYRRIYGAKQQLGRQNLAESVAEISRQNRKLQALGRSPLLDNERGGEAIFRNLMRGYQDIQGQAAGDTEKLLNAGYSNLNTMGTQKAQLASNKAGIQGNLLGAIAKIFNL